MTRQIFGGDMNAKFYEATWGIVDGVGYSMFWNHIAWLPSVIHSFSFDNYVDSFCSSTD
jgi:hypothetical protein